MTSPYAIALSHFAPFGSRTYVRLFGFYKTYEDVWNATKDELVKLEVSDKNAEKFIAWRNQTDPQKLANDVAALGIDTIDRDDPRFPKALKTIYDPPIILYIRGVLPTTNQLVGIVGSRDATPYGIKTAQRFSSELTQAGLIVVSGLARGIDVEAHAGAMAAGGKTIAVLAHGLKELYGAKKDFANRIIEQGGAIISEQPPYHKAQKYHFPIRNRIIAGLSRGVVIVEAQIASGTLRTAQAAIEAHREVFAIPGPIDSPTSEGTNKLLQDGAHVTTSTNDVLFALGFPKEEPFLAPILVPAPLPDHSPTPSLELPPPPGGGQEGSVISPMQALLLAHLTNSPIHVDELARCSGLSTSQVLGTLTILEIHGKVRPLGNMYYSL